MRKKYIGIDLHTDNFVAFFLCEDHSEQAKYELSADGFKAFIKRVSKIDELAVEATGNSKFFLDKVRAHVGECTLVDPGQFLIIAHSTKKTDYNDAKSLAFFLSKKMLPKARQKTFISQQMISMLHTRAMLVKSRMKLNHKTKTILNRSGIKLSGSKLIYMGGYDKYVFCYEWDEMVRIELEFLAEQVTFLNIQIAKFDKIIQSYAKQLNGYKNIISINGIGVIYAATIIAHIDNIHDFSCPKKLCSYFGIVPRVRQSNKNDKRGRITKRGSRQARTALIMSTWQVIKYSPYLNDYYTRLRESKGGKRAVVATANKLLKIIYDALKNDWIFEDFSEFKYYVDEK